MAQISVAQEKNRVLAFDILRVIAIMAVVMIHVAAEFMTKNDIGSEPYIVGHFFNSLSRMGVPIFFMISGALILNEEKNLSFRKCLCNARNMFVLLILWSAFYAGIEQVFVPLLSQEPFSLNLFLKAFFLGHYHLWYLYVIIGLYLVSPILRAFVKRKNATLVKYYLALSLFLCSLVPLADYTCGAVFGSCWTISSFFGQFRLSFLNEYVMYYLLGWYITNIEFNKTSCRAVYILGGIGVFVTFASEMWISTTEARANTVFYDYGALNVVLHAAAVFLFIYRQFKGKTTYQGKRLIIQLSSLSFGVYVIHILVLYLVKNLIPQWGNTTVTLISYHVITMLISFAISFAISKIPFLRKSIHC